MAKWLGIDVGGANIKAADGRGFAASRPFAVWRKPQGLADQLRTLLAECPQNDHVAVTMTAELADCYPSKSEGVLEVVAAVEEATRGRHLRFYRDDGRLVAAAVARNEPLRFAAANWHALATYCGRHVPRDTALVMDIGSTTTDLTPLREGQLVGAVVGDTQRLMSHWLVYTGMERTPVCALVEHLTYRGRPCPVAAELFATTLDAYLLLGLIAESPTSTETADGRPATKGAARARMGRMISAANDEFNHRDAVLMAEEVVKAQAGKLAAAVEEVCLPFGGLPAQVVVAGHGEPLANRVLIASAFTGRTISLATEIGSLPSRCATAHALAVLAAERTV